MGDALLATLRDLARRQSARAAQTGTSIQSVERHYERNEETHHEVEYIAADALTSPAAETGPSIATEAEIAESLCYRCPESGDRRHEKNEINEKTLSYGSGIPPEWNDGFARLHQGRLPGDVPSGRWRQFINDCGRLLGAGRIEEAARLGWSAADLFGCSENRPFARLDQMGLVWYIKGGRVVSMSMSAAVIETPSGAQQTYRRKDGVPEQVLVWELIKD